MGHLATRLHARLLHLSRGRLGGRIAGQPVLVLETTGRRSGEPRRAPVQYVPIEEGYLLVAANHGAPRAPDWYLNLRAEPRVRIEVGGRRVEVEAREPLGREREALWRRLAEANPLIGRTAEKARAAGRERLPLIVLTTHGR